MQENPNYEITLKGAFFNVPKNDDLAISYWKKIAQLEYEPRTFEIISKLVKNKDCALEIGIDKGQTTFATAFYAGHLIAIEPSLESILSIRSILDLNPKLKKKVTLIHGALTDSDKVVLFGRNNRFFDDIHFIADPKPVEVNGFTIASLDKLATNHISFINMDIEGGEYRV